jgi:hypothetical protein
VRNTILISLVVISLSSCRVFNTKNIDINFPIIASISKYTHNDQVLSTHILEYTNDSISAIHGTTIPGSINSIASYDAKYGDTIFELYLNTPIPFTTLEYGIQREGVRPLLITQRQEFFGGFPPSYTTNEFIYQGNSLEKISYNDFGDNPYDLIPEKYDIMTGFLFSSNELISYVNWQTSETEVENISMQYYENNETALDVNTNIYNNIALNMDYNFIVKFISPLHSIALLADGRYSLTGKKTDKLIRTITIHQTGFPVRIEKFTYEKDASGHITKMNHLDGAAGDTLKFYYIFEYL